MFNDTIVVNSIKEDVFWTCCDSNCNGYQIDYYDNGNIRLEGFFKNGRPKGEIKFYRPDGSIESIIFYKGKYRKGKAFKHGSYFDKEGNQIG